MKRIIRREKSQEQGIYERLMEDPQLYVLTYSFHTFRGRKNFTYAILKRGEGLACETTSRRKFDLCDQQAALPSRLGVFHPKGEIFVLDRCSTHHLACSEVTGNILVGSHLRSRGDLQRLREKGVASVLALQSERELKRQGFSPHYLRLLCEENGLSYRCYAIEDMNAEDFITKADGGVQLIRELLKEGGVYVYCSAGVYRSPQLVALYLVLHEHYSLEDAISLVRKRHPFARPSYKTLHAALRLANLKKYLRKIPI
jgi:protein-tyrosine phosphatase